jgi:hypothetical protein
MSYALLLAQATLFSFIFLGATGVVKSSFCPIPLVHELVLKPGRGWLIQANALEFTSHNFLLNASILSIGSPQGILLATLFDSCSDTRILLFRSADAFLASDTCGISFSPLHGLRIAVDGCR